MSDQADRAFFLYSDGYLPQELALGHLVFGSYAAPGLGRQCPMEPLGENELDAWADVQLRTDFCYSTSSLQGAGFSILAIDLIKAGASGTRATEYSVATKRCRRITLKNPQRFLSERVLAVDSARATVQEWLSMSANEYVLNMLSKLEWRPKIWMVTGVYELENCTSFTWNKSDISAEAGVAAEIMALFNIPLGVNGNVNRSRGSFTQQTLPGQSIWAARYQLLDAKYIRVAANERDNPSTPRHMPLRLKAIWSSGGWKGNQNDDKSKEPDNMAVLAMGNEFSSGFDGDSESEQAFWVQFAKAEEDWKDGFDI